MTISAERLRAVLSYDSITGDFRWLIEPNRRIKVGSVAGTTGSHGYRNIKIDGTLYRAHRLAFLWMDGTFPSAYVDHVDGNPLNNSWANLRRATPSENNQNRSGPLSNNTSGYLGVTKCKRTSGWIAQIVVNKRRHHLGTHPTPEAAHSAYVNAKASIHQFQPTIRENALTYQKAAAE